MEWLSNGLGTITDNDGTLLFSQADIESLGAKSCAALDRIYAVAQRLNGLAPEDIKELAKNSEAGLSEDSISS